MPKSKPATKFVITLKITLEDPAVDYQRALAFKSRIAELAGDLAPGQSGAVGSSIEDWAQLQSRAAMLRTRLGFQMPGNKADGVMQILREMGYVPQA